MKAVATWQQAHGWAPGWYCRLGDRQLYIRAGIDKDTNAVLGWYAFVDGVKIGAFSESCPDQAKLAAERHVELQRTHAGKHAAIRHPDAPASAGSANANGTSRKRRSAAA